MNCTACKYFDVSVYDAAVHYLWKTTKFTNSSFDHIHKQLLVLNPMATGHKLTVCSEGVQKAPRTSFDVSCTFNLCIVLSGNSLIMSNYKE